MATINLRVGCEFSYDVSAPTPATVQVRPRSDSSHQLLSETWSTTPSVPVDEYADIYGNPVKRFVMPPGSLVLRYDAVCAVPDRRCALELGRAGRNLLGREKEVVRAGFRRKGKPVGASPRDRRDRAGGGHVNDVDARPGLAAETCEKRSGVVLGARRARREIRGVVAGISRRRQENP